MRFDELASTRHNTHFFLRNDDVDVVEDRLVTLLDICRHRHVPITLAVIPGKLTAECATLLRGRAKDIELHQHGWVHSNHEIQGKKCEFGPTRTLEQQRGDILAGRARMDQAFGSGWFPAFTPPWNRYSVDTLQVLEELNFAVLSADGTESNPTGAIRHIPITIDLHQWKGNPRLRPSEEITQSLISQIELLRPIGILMHHKVMDEAAFDFLDSLLAELTRHPQARFETFETLSAAHSLKAGNHVC